MAMGGQLRLRAALLLLTLALVPPGFHGCDIDHSICGVYSPGDVLIGIMLPSHQKVNKRLKPEGFQCSDFDVDAFMKSMAVIHALEEVNRAGLLPGVRLGYVMCDTCSDAAKALQNVESMLQFNTSLITVCSHTDFRPGVKAIVGARFSEVSIAVARLLSVYMIPQVSGTSSAPILSDKLRFGPFLRTVPSDVHQTKALAKVISQFGWNWVGVVYGDDDYGKAAFQSFVQDAEDKNICLAFQEVLPHNLDHPDSGPRIRAVAETIRSSNARVVILILRAELVEAIFKEMIKSGTSRTWISSDAWSRSRTLAHMDGINKVGDILGFTFMAEKCQSFDHFLQNLAPPPGGYNHFIEEYKTLRFNCSSDCHSDRPPPYCPLDADESGSVCNLDNPQGQNDDYLVRSLDTSDTFAFRAAVWAIAHALKKLLKCSRTECTGETDFPPWKLLDELKTVRFTLSNHTCYFDEHGDFVNGYDLVMWQRDGDHRRFQRIGSYLAVTGIIQLDVDVVWHSTANGSVPQSNCSESCPPGTFKKILDVSCCYNCTECPGGTFSDQEDQSECQPCPAGFWSDERAAQCQRRLMSFLRWSQPYPIVIIWAAVVGVLLLLAALAIFLTHANSPSVNKAELKLSCVMAAGLVLSFASVLCFMGKPDTHLCRARQLTYALGFTLCVSCILVKAFRTFVFFLVFHHDTQRKLIRLYKPALTVIILTTLQAIICLLWLIFDSPDLYEQPPDPESRVEVIQCTEGPKYIGFGVMLSYIALLAFIGFLLAYKNSRLPSEVSETGYILFSMLMYLFVWVCFVPVYITNKQERAYIQASAILVSNYGIIFCHFLPICFGVFRESRMGSQGGIGRRLRDCFKRTGNTDTRSESTTSEDSGQFSGSSPSLGMSTESVNQQDTVNSSQLDIEAADQNIPAYSLSPRSQTTATRRTRRASC